MTEISELQKKRSENIIWNGAGRYDFSPDFKAYDKDGKAVIYWNLIVGAARSHYNYALFEKLFQALDRYEEVDVYEGLLWLGLENAVYQKEVPNRPVLSSLRAQYALELVAQLSLVDESGIYDAVAKAHFQRALGLSPKLSGLDAKLLDEIEFSPDMTTEDIVTAAKAYFIRWFQVDVDAPYHPRAHMPSFGIKKRAFKRSAFRPFGLGFAVHPDNAYGGSDAALAKDPDVISKLSAQELRDFMEMKFGRSLYSPMQLRSLEKQLCVGNHQNCSLLVTRGEEQKGDVRSAFEALEKQKEAHQRELNRQSFYNSYAQNMCAIASLAGKIQNSVLMHLQPSPVKADSGVLNGTLVWRATALDDNKVFVKTEQADMGDLSVDILLDASTSQKERQEAVSNQGYMIASALSRCSIPCRVMSFCSMTGFTILRLFKDYNESAANEKIFDYVSNGCNRDGLAVRLTHRLMNESPYEHKILIILSDVKPNDIRKIRDSEGNALASYESDAGVRDTAFEVRSARADGISVICVFTGTDDDLPAARLVYGRDFTRIRSMAKFADAVGTLIQNQIKIL